MEATRFSWRRGTVTSFDAKVGLGRIRLDDAGDRVLFHAVAIGDGSRRIDVGEAVWCRMRPAALGTWEASDIRPTRASSGPAPRPPAD